MFMQSGIQFYIDHFISSKYTALNEITPFSGTSDRTQSNFSIDLSVRKRKRP